MIATATESRPKWHYEYTIGQMLHHFDADSFQECVDALMHARRRSPQLTGVRVFAGSSRSEMLDLDQLA